MPDYRSLIEQVQARGGPLWLEHWNDRAHIVLAHPNVDFAYKYVPLADSPMSTFESDVLCGVLRRDLVKRGYRVEHYHFPPSEGEEHHSLNVRLRDGTGRGTILAERDMLTAFLRAWLEAVPEEADA